MTPRRTGLGGTGAGQWAAAAGNINRRPARGWAVATPIPAAANGWPLLAGRDPRRVGVGRSLLQPPPTAAAVPPPHARGRRARRRHLPTATTDALARPASRAGAAAPLPRPARLAVVPPTWPTVAPRRPRASARHLPKPPPVLPLPGLRPPVPPPRCSPRSARRTRHGSPWLAPHRPPLSPRRHPFRPCRLSRLLPRPSARLPTLPLTAPRPAGRPGRCRRCCCRRPWAC